MGGTGSSLALISLPLIKEEWTLPRTPSRPKLDGGKWNHALSSRQEKRSNPFRPSTAMRLRGTLNRQRSYCNCWHLWTMRHTKQTSRVLFIPYGRTEPYPSQVWLPWMKALFDGTIASWSWNTAFVLKRNATRSRRPMAEHTTPCNLLGRWTWHMIWTFCAGQSVPPSSLCTAVHTEPQLPVSMHRSSPRRPTVSWWMAW